MPSEIRHCVVCQVAVQTQRYTIVVDGDPLRSVDPILCPEHGLVFIFWIRALLGEMTRTGGGRVSRRALNPTANARDALQECFAEYCDDFGEGYDAESFVDFVVAQLCDLEPQPHSLIDWFQAHASALQRISGVAREDASRCDSLFLPAIGDALQCCLDRGHSGLHRNGRGARLWTDAQARASALPRKLSK